MSTNDYYAKEVNAPQAKEFYRSHFHEMVLMNKAHGRMLVKQGLLSAEDYRTIAAGLDQVDRELSEDEIRGEQGDLYYNLTKALYDRIGEDIGCRIHLGRSRNDMNRTCDRMQVRRELAGILDALVNLMETMLTLSGEHLDTVITYYTYGQPSQPGTYGHYLLFACDRLFRDFRRLEAAYENTNHCPMGAAAGIGTGYSLDPAYISDLLGFDGPIENSMDAISSPDYVLEIESALAILMTTISSLAQDLFFWASYEYGILDCDDSITTGSSIMPQKKNPSAIEQVRVSSGHAIGLLNDSLALLRNTSLFPNMEASIEIFYTFDTCVAEIRKALDLLDVVFKNSRIRAEKSYAYTRDNFSGATTMAEVLAQKYHVPFTMTHHILHGMIHRLMEQDTLNANDLTAELMADVSEKILGKPLLLTDEEVRQMMDPIFCLEQKVTGGTPKRSDAEELLHKRQLLLQSKKDWLCGVKQQVEKAYNELHADLIP